jgi:hypothetical protein
MPTMIRAMQKCVFAALLAFVPAAAVAADWKPIDPADLALKSPKIQPDADAEALLWEVRVSDRMDIDYDVKFTTTFDHYLRIKIFTDRGRDAHATVDIPYTSNVRIRDVAARTIRPDGSIVELKKSDVYQRTVVKADDLKVKAFSFAVPAIERGVIVEYRWREVHLDSIASELRLPFSREMPVQLVRYYLEPLPLGNDFGMMTLPFNGKFTPPERQKNGLWMVSLADVPAERSEPFAPPALQREPWMFVFYAERNAPRGKDMWLKFAKELHADYSRRAKPDDDIRRVAAEAVAGADSDAARIQALARVARNRIRRVDVDTADPAERKAAKENKNAGDALKRGVGGADDVLVVFLALANAAGLEARVAASPNRATLFHRPAIHDHTAFLSGRLAAVRTASGWTIVDPANEHSEHGELRWFYEGQDVLLSDAKEIVAIRSAATPAAKSLKQRTGTFKLTEDGTLEGDCRIVYSGHWAQTIREDEDQDAAAERDKNLKELITKRVPGADVSDIRIENATDPAQPYVNAYHIRIPGFAQRTGSRLFLRPAMFQRGVEALFPAATRSSDVYFRFAWAEEDAVTIELPAGFALEQAVSPAPADAGIAKYSVSITTKDGWRHLNLKRAFSFGVGDATVIAAANYRPLKQFFDHVHESDAHTLVMRRESGQ